MLNRVGLAHLEKVVSLTGKPLRTANEETALCSELLGKVASIRDDLAASTAESEEIRHLAPKALAHLKSSKLLNMRLMEQMGGHEASIATQCQVLAALAEADSASSWCSMVHNNGVGTLAAYFPDAAVDEIFRDDVPTVSFVAAPSGTARRVNGGYSLTGHWRFCSGFHNAEWIVCGAKSDGDPARNLLIVVPKADVEAVDNWNTSGLRGTGSLDFKLTDYFVPAERAIDNDDRVQVRGSRFYGRPGILIAVYEHAAFAWGIGRRALRLLAEQSQRLGEGHPARDVIHSELGRLSIELEAAAGVMLHYYTVLETLSAEESAEPRVCLHGRAIATYLTETAARCADAAFRRAGTRAGFLPNEIDRTIRDIRMAQAHILVTDANYGHYGNAVASEAAHAASQ